MTDNTYLKRACSRSHLLFITTSFAQFVYLDQVQIPKFSDVVFPETNQNFDSVAHKSTTEFGSVSDGQ